VALEVARNTPAFTGVAVYEPGVSINGSIPKLDHFGIDKKGSANVSIMPLSFPCSIQPPDSAKTQRQRCRYNYKNTADGENAGRADVVGQQTGQHQAER